MLKSAVKRVLDSVRVGGKPVLTDFLRNALRGIRASRRRAQGSKTRARMLAIVAERPLDINIESSNYCAASCVFCPNSKVKRKKTTMDMDLFRKVVDDYVAIGGGAMGICSMQSDVFSDDLLVERVAYLERYDGKLYVYSTTNLIGASKLSDDDLERVLRRLDLLQISLGGTNKADYRQMYGINAFDVVKAQLKRVAGIVRAKGLKVKLGLYFRTAHAAGVAGSDLVKELGDDFAILENRDAFFSWGGIIGAQDLPEGAKLLTVDNRNARVDCAVSSASLSVSVDGSVVGCGCVDWNSQHVVGNVSDHTITEVWTSKPFADFRAAFSSGHIPDLCKDCSLYSPIDDAFAQPALDHYTVTDGLYYLQ